MKKFQTLMLRLGYFVIMLLFYGCQEEEREFIDNTPDDVITTDSVLGSSLQKIAMHDGSFDDVVDKGNCYSIELPVDLIVNGQRETITNIEQYVDLKQDDEISINYPIVVTHHNYSETTINNKEELDSLSRICTPNTDEDIECVDFRFPFTFFVYNTRTNILTTEIVEHDQDVFQFMERIDENTLISIQYPIEMVISQGQLEEALHNEGLLATILTYASICDEQDE